MTRTVNISDEALISQLEDLKQTVLSYAQQVNVTTEDDQETQAELDTLDAAIARLSPPPSPADEELIEKVARTIWHRTYVHDTLLTWSELKPGQMHHKRVMEAAKAAVEVVLSPVHLEKGKNG